MTYRRSLLPGRAHIEYWEDEAVFGHFIETVVDRQNPARGRFLNPPRDRPLAGTVSWMAPQLGMAALLMLGVYLIYRAVTAAIGEMMTPLGVGRDVVGIGLLLLAVTAAARIPRLMDHPAWWPGSLLVLIPITIVYAHVTCPATQVLVGGVLADGLGLPDVPLRLPIADLVPGCGPSEGRSESSALALMLVAAAIAFVSGVCTHLWPRRGALLLPALGAITAGAIIAVILVTYGGRADVELWPVMVAAIVFFYLWWLTALLFDLTFVWQRYVRASVASGSLAWLARQQITPADVERRL
jgi:hypothetical protein